LSDEHVVVAERGMLLRYPLKSRFFFSSVAKKAESFYKEGKEKTIVVEIK